LVSNNAKLLSFKQFRQLKYLLQAEGKDGGFSGAKIFFHLVIMLGKRGGDCLSNHKSDSWDFFLLLGIP
jgi:hypothetical protein